MNVEPLKTDIPKSNIQKPRLYWLKLALVFVIIFMFSWLIPYLFSNLLFSTIIKKSFSEITNYQYNIDFDNLRINILTRQITFTATEIKKSIEADTTKHQQIHFHSDTLWIRNINIKEFIKNKKIKLQSIQINELKLAIENNEKQTKNALNLPLSEGLSELFISDLKINQAEICYKTKNDSLFIPELNLQIQDFKIDSLSDTVFTNRFHTKNLAVTLKNQNLALANESHFMTLKKLNLSTFNKVFEIDSLIIQPNKTKNTDLKYTLNLAHFRLETFEFDSLFLHKKLIAKKIDLNLKSIAIQSKKASKKLGETDIKKQINRLLKENFNQIDLKHGQINIGKSNFKLANQNKIQFASNTLLSFDDFQFNPKNKVKFSLKDGTAIFNNLTVENSQIEKQLKIKHGDFKYLNKNLSLENIAYRSYSNSTIDLKINELLLKNINWTQWINYDRLYAEKLIVKEGDIVQQKILKSKSAVPILQDVEMALTSVFGLIKINTIEFNDWEYLLANKAMKAKGLDIEISNFKIPIDTNYAFGLFTNFNSKIDQLSWISKDQKQHFLAKDITSNSSNRKVSISNLHSFPRWKSLTNELLEDNSRYSIFSEGIHIELQQAFQKLNTKDTLIFNEFRIDSLSLKQFGHAEHTKESAVNFPPIQITNFEIGKAYFSAYNDSSALSKLSQINNIHLKGDSLELQKDSVFNLTYKHLYALTASGFYQNKTKGLNFNFQKLDFNSDSTKINLHKFQATLISNKDDNSQNHKLNSKLIQITGFNHNLFLERSIVSAKEFNMQSPILISKGNKENKKEVDFKTLFSENNIQQLPYLEFDRFIVQDFTWLATYKIKDITNISTFEKANFEAYDFKLNYKSYTDPKRLFFSKSILFHIGNFKQHIDNGNYLLIVKAIDFSSFNQKMNFNKIQFYTLQKIESNNYNFTIDYIALNNINFDDYQRNNRLSIENILIQSPNTKLRFYGFNENSTISNLNKLALYPKIKNIFSGMDLKRIDVRDMTLNLDVPKGNSTNVYNLGHVNVLMHEFKIDSTTEAFQNNRFFYAQNNLVHIRNYSAQIANNLYRVNFSDLKLSTLNKTIDIDSVSLKPQFNHVDFAAHVGTQTDRFDVDINRIKLSGVDFQDAIFRQKYTAKKVALYALNGEVYRDGLYPRIPGFKPKNPISKLLGLPYFIQVDSLTLIDSYISYKHKGEHTEVPGHIYFDNLNALALNVTNNPDFIKFGGNTVFQAQSMLMGKSALDLDVNFPLIDGGKAFNLNAKLEQIEMEDLEPILRPLALIQARTGTIKSVELSATANDDYAFGEMLMLYNNMKVEVLNKSMKKGFFGSLFANALIKTENPSYLFPRKGPIYFERNKERSLFNYWAEISILGMKTSMGLADRRIAKKVKKLKRK